MICVEKFLTIFPQGVLNLENLIVSLGLLIRHSTPTSFFVFMQKRQAEGPLHGLWEFPGGKIEYGESPDEALKRELSEEIGAQSLQKSDCRLFKIYPFSYPEKKVILYAFLVNYSDEKILDFGKWFEISFDANILDLKEIIPAANIEILEDLTRYVKDQYPSFLTGQIWK